MPTLKQLKNRLNAVKNIRKITMSMKVVSAAKYSRAEKELQMAKAYGAGVQAFFSRAECTQDENAPRHLIVALTSDRGLCGSVHSNIARRIRAEVPLKPAGVETKLICIGDKARAQLQRTHRESILMHFTDIGKTVPNFSDAGVIARNILSCEYDHGELLFNKFKTVVSQEVIPMPLYNADRVNSADKLTLYDSVDANVLQSYNEFALVSKVFYALKESACSEQAARMTAMDGASKNAGEMIDKLTLQYNRSRQAVITKELIEIISGADAIK